MSFFNNLFSSKPAQGQLESVDRLDSRQFVMAVKRLADSLNYGADRSPFIGSGVEYVQSRQYQPGDPIRMIDWRVTARTGKVHVKEYEAPKRLPAMLLVDSSASMTISSTKLSKYALAVHIAGGLAFACLDRLSPVGLMTVGQRRLRYDPSLSKQRIMQWLHDLRYFQYDEPTRLSECCRELETRLNSRSFIIILSDFHEPEAMQQIKYLAQRHDVVAIALSDPAENGLDAVGFMRAQEAETETTLLVRGGQQLKFSLSLKEEFQRAGIDHLQLQTDQAVSHKLRFFFQARGLLGKSAR